MHRPLHQARWGEIELWSAVPEIALMISSRRDQGLLEGYCAGGVDEGVGASVRKWKEILNNDDQTFICLSSCTVDGDTHIRVKKRCPSGHISFWWTEKEQFIQNWKFCHHLLPLVSFKTGLTFFVMWNTKADTSIVMSQLLFLFKFKWIVHHKIKILSLISFRKLRLNHCCHIN